MPLAGALSDPWERYRLQYTHERVKQRARRLSQQSAAFRDRYRWRAGIEGTISRLKHQMGLAQLRVRGQGAVQYRVLLRALGLNIHRVAAWRGSFYPQKLFGRLLSALRCHQRVPGSGKPISGSTGRRFEAPTTRVCRWLAPLLSRLFAPHQGVKYRPYPEDLDAQGVALPVDPGDIVFLDNKVMHSSVPNRSREDYRWAYNFRYLPIGQPPGRPFIPGFVARSRSAPETELHNAYLWSAMWVRCLDYLTEEGAPTSYEGMSKMGLEEARAITSHWRELAPDVDGWLRLGKD